MKFSRTKFSKLGGKCGNTSLYNQIQLVKIEFAEDSFHAMIFCTKSISTEHYLGIE